MRQKNSYLAVFAIFDEKINIVCKITDHITTVYIV